MRLIVKRDNIRKIAHILIREHTQSYLSRKTLYEFERISRRIFEKNEFAVLLKFENSLVLR